MDLKYKCIIIDRRGDVMNSNMTTVEVINEVCPKKNYHIIDNNLIETDELKRGEPLIDGPNKYVAIPNTWDTTLKYNTERSNILGRSGTIHIEEDHISIPITQRYSFFGVKMYKVGDIISFNHINTSLPVCNVNIGINYINDYIMKDAGGVYLEYHDRPHFHMPRNSSAGGYIVVGREIDEFILLAAIKIPFGYALYMPNYVIHNDCFLTGDYTVVYSQTPNYSNVLLCNKKNIPVKVTIEL